MVQPPCGFVMGEDVQFEPAQVEITPAILNGDCHRVCCQAFAAVFDLTDADADKGRSMDGVDFVDLDESHNVRSVLHANSEEDA